MQTVGNRRERTKLIDKGSQLSIRCQCRLLNIHRSMVYYKLAGESRENHMQMNRIDQLHIRKILYWELSNSLDTAFCLQAIKRAIRKYGVPEIMKYTGEEHSVLARISHEYCVNFNMALQFQKLAKCRYSR